MILKLGAFRTKSRTIPDVWSVIPLSEIWSNGVKTGTFATASPIKTKSWSEIITYTSNRKGSRHTANYCVHVVNQLHYSGTSGDSVFVQILGPGNEGSHFIYYGHHSQSAAAHASAVPLALVALGASLNATDYLAQNGVGLMNAAFNRVRPDLTELSVPNFLAELDDLKSLFKLWKRSVSLAKNVAGAHLNYKFGWKPTIGDIHSVISALTGLQAKLEAFRKMCGTTISKTITVDRQSVSKSGTFNLSGNSHYKVNWSGTLTSTVKANIQYKILPLQEMSNLELQLRGMLDSLGVELNPRIIWDALPFTFVIDWFFGVGSWLERFKIDTLELPILLVDGSLNHKRELKVESSYKENTTGYPTDSSSPVYASGWTQLQKTFYRLPILPDYATLAGLGWRMPTLGQQMLLVSLATVLKR